MSGEFYVSVDVETDGPLPGDCNMVSVGASVWAQHGCGGFDE